MSDNSFRGGFMNFMNSSNFGNSPSSSNSNSRNSQIPPTHNQFPSTPPTPQDIHFMNSYTHPPFSYPFFSNSSPSFSPGYYVGYGQNIMSHPSMAPHPNRPIEGDQEHVIVAENEVPPVVTQEKSSRSVKWSAKEEEMLISSWLTVSNDSVIGNAQTRGSFWGRVTDYFNMYRKTKIEREEPRIKSHYYFLMPQVNEFNCYYNQIVSDHHNGWSDNQIIEANKEFPYMHIWEMVKDEPKWAAQIEAQNASKKAKTSESGVYTSSSNRDPEEHCYGGNESENRPIGQKAAKRKLKEKGKKNVTELVNVDFEHRWK
uniref:No apical meristem-associated C-terminal domain-containing protein n=1 Tax=Kalanchoe fedtschenkoi TaxID=63787 RepID=A0A7N1A5X0_KALFE